MPRTALALVAVCLLGVLVLPGCFWGGDDADLTIYSGRTESLIQPLIDQFSEETGLKVEVKYGDSAEMAALLREEGDKSPADIYLAQDAGALGSVSDAGLLATIPQSELDKVAPAYRSPKGEWVGTSGRSRVIVYNTDMVQSPPDSVMALTDPEWRGKVGWAPTNGSFQSFMTAFRKVEGEDAARQWLEAMEANGVKTYENNVAIVAAVGTGEIELGLVNHYYLYGFLRDQGDGFKARNAFTKANDPGSLVNVSGAGIVKTTGHQANAERFVDFLLSEEAQHYFSEQTFEYPLADGVQADPRLRPLDELDPPDIDLGNLDDLQGTVNLLRSVGVIS